VPHDCGGKNRAPKHRPIDDVMVEMHSASDDILLSTTAVDDDPGDFVPDKQVRRELGNITAVTLWEYTNDPRLDFPPPIKIRNRNFRSRKLLNAFKKRRINEASDDRETARKLSAPAREARARLRDLNSGDHL
jgi:hypothetical protein